MEVKIIEPNAFVTVAYTLKNEKGDVLDASAGEEGEPIRYVHGYGMLVPGLEAALDGKKMGDRFDVVVSAEEGFGTRDDELVIEVDRGDFPDPDKVTPGDEFIAESPDGDEVVMRVVEVRDDSVLVDANHPLAGEVLHYEVDIQEVRAATDEEIEQAASDFDMAAEHVHGPDCDHDHAESGELIALKKKPAAPN